jgi:hypothetical protein
LVCTLLIDLAGQVTIIRDSIVIGIEDNNVIIGNPLVGNIVTVAANAPFSLSSFSVTVTPNAILEGSHRSLVMSLTSVL